MNLMCADEERLIEYSKAGYLGLSKEQRKRRSYIEEEMDEQLVEDTSRTKSSKKSI